MRKTVIAVLLVAAMSMPASAAARIDALDPSGPGSPLTAGKALMADETQLLTASLPERAFGGEGAPSPLGVGNSALDPAPKELADFPTSGSTYALLSSGDVNTIAAQLTNESSSTSTAFEEQIEAFERGPQAEDWTVLKLDVNVPGGANCLAVDYRFFSEEFPEFVGSPFNDAFIAEVDSTGWSVGEGGELTRPSDFAVSPSGSPASVNGLGEAAVSEEEAAGTYFDAATGLITTKTPITSGLHSVYFSIFDASDEIYDSAVFLDNMRFVTEDPSTCRPPLGKEIEVPPPGVTPPPPPPSNAFVLGPSVKFKKGGTKVIITVEVPGPGTLEAGSPPSGAKASALRQRLAGLSSAPRLELKCKPKAKKRCRKRGPLLLPTKVTATAAGPVKITVSLSGAGKSLLAKKRKLTVPVQLVFTPVGGTPATQTKTVVFKKLKAKRAKQR